MSKNDTGASNKKQSKLSTSQPDKQRPDDKGIAKATVQAISADAESESSTDSISEEEALNLEYLLKQEGDNEWPNDC